jgi:regulatory factor X
VALSTNSVAASVEPVIQQQFYSLGPEDGFESMDVRSQGLMAHTPTTSSMLAALQQDTYETSLDHTASAYNPDAYGPMAYMDTSTSHDDPLGAGHQPSLSFSDFGGSASSFDVSSFASQDLSINAAVTPSRDSDASHSQDPDAVKVEQPVTT